MGNVDRKVPFDSRRLRQKVSLLEFRAELTHSSILLVGQDATTESEWRRAVEPIGYTLAAAAMLSDAIDYVARHAPEIVVTELKLVDGTGLDLLSIVRVNQPNTRVTIATAFGSIASAVQAIKWGATDYLLKPLSAPDIQQSIRQVPCRCSPEGVPVAPRPNMTSPRVSLSRHTWEYIQRVLTETGSVSGAARKLGVDRRSLRRTLAKYPPPETMPVSSHSTKAQDA